MARTYDVTLLEYVDSENVSHLLVYRHGNKLVGSIPIDTRGISNKLDGSASLPIPSSSDAGQK